MLWRKSGKENGQVVFVADVGGTNTTFALLGIEQEKYSLLWQQRYSSKSITSFSKVVGDVVQAAARKSNSPVTQACFAGAGPVDSQGKSIKITHLPWTIEEEKIREAAGLASVLLINDFDAVAYGIDAVPPQDIVQLKPGKAVSQAPRALLGPGTGLGKSIMLFSGEKNYYFPIASEGGHASAALETEEEFALARFLQNNVQNNEKSPVVAWEDLVSGKGLVNIYRFLEENKEIGKTKIGKIKTGKLEIRQSGYDPAVIAHYRNSDPLCQKTFDLFVRFTARCAKNLALEAVARGGVYLAGGITAKNVDIFQRQVFKDEFIHTKNMKELLEQIPIYAITTYDVSLYGAARAVLLGKKAEKKVKP